MMNVCYNKLFIMLIDKGMKKKDFRQKVGISQTTMAKLANNEYISMDILVRICRKMDCTVDRIMDILPETVIESESSTEESHCDRI